MSNDDLVGAYIEGKISRRTLIRRLVAAGVTLGGATAYAHHLAPKAAAKGGPNEYPRVKLRILTDTTKEVGKDGVVRVRVKSADPCTLTINASVSQGMTWSQSGQKIITFGESGGKKEIKVTIPDADQLNRKKKSEAEVEAISDEGIYDPVVATKEKQLEG